MRNEPFGVVLFDSCDEDSPLLVIRYYRESKEFSFDFRYGCYFAPSNRRPINDFFKIASSKESFIEYCEKSIKRALPGYDGEGKVVYYRLNKLSENLKDINKVEHTRVTRMFKKIKYTIIIVKKNKMILRRLGNKKAMWMDVYSHFPKHTTYAEPFFGAGGMFFNKPKSKYNFVNDLDSDVYNLFKVVLNQKEDLKGLLKIMPISTELLDYWKKNKETEPIKKALRFLFLSNFTLYSKMSTLNTSEGNTMDILLSNIDETFRLLYGAVFTNWDFRKFIKVVSESSRHEDELLFYCDPPYLDTSQNYETPIWKEQDLIDLIDCLVKTNAKFAISEFSNDSVIKIAKDYELNLTYIKERKSIFNRNTEIIITNYNKQLTLF